MRALTLLVVAALAIPLHAAAARPADPAILELDPGLAATNPGAQAIASGSLDSRFAPFTYRDARKRGGSFWLSLRWQDAQARAGVPVVIVDKGRHLNVELYAPHGAGMSALQPVTALPSFGGLHQAVFVLPQAVEPSRALYAHVRPAGRGAELLRFSRSTLDAALADGAEHSRMIALAFGALAALALGSLLIWFVLADKLFVLYGAIFSLQALYIAYLSGQGFDWPLLSYAAPLMSHAWNVPAALSGAAACLFVREIADLRRFMPRSYRVFGWFAVAFVVLAFANLADLIGLGGLVAMIGNLVFVSAAVFTLVAAFMAWRQGSRAAGWFLIAWTLLEAATIATAVRLLVADAEGAEGLLYYGLPLSMVVAAAFVALGVADRLREQRAALSDAERRAQTDPLTGVLNRRSIVERLEAACARARARGLPISLLFIDLDHFKQINDTYGHAAGDACLHAIIKPIQAELRQSDVVGRYGGEEFIVILSSADVAAARPIAERIRARVAEIQVQGFGQPIQLTCSIGVATSDMLNVWGESLIARADAAVYAAKKGGRNNVQVAAPVAA